MKLRTLLYIQITFVCFSVQQLHAQNPVIQTMYTADPAPLVYKDTLFLYVGRDEAEAPKNHYLMREYRLFTTTDMVNWTDRGAPLRTSQIKWSVGDASAAQVVERNGKFYWYISTMNNTPGKGGVSVGVMVADSPHGPFKDPLGGALVTNDMTTHAKHSWDDLDPSVFIDDDGQAYLFWGNGVCYWAKLNQDMISLDGPIHVLDAKDKSIFGPGFTEAPWIYKKNKMYYMHFASGFPESLHYATSKSITGPWKYENEVMALERGSNTNHPGVIDYKGKSYFFYHNDALPAGHSYARSVAVEEFQYGANGEFPKLKMSAGTITAMDNINPYKRVQAETIAFSEGVKSIDDKQKGVIIGDIHNNDYIKVRNVDFGEEGATKFNTEVSSRYHGGNIEVRLGSVDGEVLGSLKVPYTGEWDNWKTVKTNIKKITGIHDLFFVFKGGSPHTLFLFDHWQFEH
ncbi:glycoside hydrolase family 43 protein [Sphingobacterium bovistauri]|uniref:Family 43 glycosylhydrolase n=1 Tax=Sphingobacterium bovistauri TaxID=2781959 RepID=A0ABS7Z7E9_9SPHI|nr:glycoside hydrolase family 43 protein [Sphingobacterium bovistauri]MCA5004634.1 family 43 glycosylhydrolase [Sphingobacterium bovistauri]